MNFPFQIIKILIQFTFGLLFSIAGFAQHPVQLPQYFTLQGSVVSSTDWRYGARAATTDSAGKIYVSGYIERRLYGQVEKAFHGSISKYHPDGTLDTTFGTGGFHFFPLGTHYHSPLRYAEALVQNDGKIVLLAKIDTTDPDDYGDDMIVRFHTNGTIDQSFGSGGFVRISTSDINGYPANLRIQSDGKIVFRRSMETSYDPVNYTYKGGEMIRLHPSGTFDSGFGKGGILSEIDIKGSMLRFTEHQVQFDVKPGGGFVCKVTNETQNDVPNEYSYLHLKDDGTFDDSFEKMDYVGAAAYTTVGNVYVNADGTYMLETEEGYRQYEPDGTPSAVPLFDFYSPDRLSLHKGNYVAYSGYSVRMRQRETAKPTNGIGEVGGWERGSTGLSQFELEKVQGFLTPAGISNDRYVLMDSIWIESEPYGGNIWFIDIKPRVRQAQSIVGFDRFSNRSIRFGDAPIEMEGVTATSGLDVKFSSSNSKVLRVNGNVLHILGAGNAIITATQAGDLFYAAAPSLTWEVEVEKAMDSIQFKTKPKRRFLKGSRFKLRASSLSGRKVVFRSSDTKVIRIKNGVAIIKGVGNVSIVASLRGNQNYHAAQTVRRVIRIHEPVRE